MIGILSPIDLLSSTGSYYGPHGALQSFTAGFLTSLFPEPANGSFSVLSFKSGNLTQMHLKPFGYMEFVSSSPLYEVTPLSLVYL